METRDSLENPSVDLVTALVAETDGTSATSIALTPAKALRLTAVYSAVRVISESIASLPLPIYTSNGTSRERVETAADTRWRLLNSMPNAEMTAMELWETWLGHTLLWGLGYIYVIRDQTGKAVELWPLRPDRTRPMRTQQGQLYYHTILDNGEPAQLMPEEVMVMHAIFGLSPIKVARESLTAAIAAEEYAGRFWANNARPGGVIQFDGKLNDTEYEEIRRRWRAGHEGLKRGQLVGILTGGATWKDVGISPALAQFLETRQYGVEEIARLYRVPPHMIMQLQHVTNRATVEQQAIELVTYTLRPWIVRAEQSIRKDVFNLQSDLKSQVYPEFQVEALMRGDQKSRYEAYGLGIQWGFLSRADVRQIENLPVVPGSALDEFLVPLNMGPSGALLDPNSLLGENASALGLLSLLTRNRITPGQADMLRQADVPMGVDADEHADVLAQLADTREQLARRETLLYELEAAMHQLAASNGHPK